jgi:hypothetical protein
MSGKSSKQRFEKHLRLSARFDGNRFVLLDGSQLPALLRESVVDLILAPESILDATVRARFLEEMAVMILERDSGVFFGVSPTMIDNMKAVGLTSPNDLQVISEYWFVEGKLDAPLMLQVRGDQEARLSPCSCTIPSLNRTADSLNHAFTLISEAFETKRRSHSGNVFERVYTQVTAGKWQSLDELRVVAIAGMQAGTKRDVQDS